MRAAVFWGQRVTARAMRFPGMLRGGALAAQAVDAPRYRLKMSWVAACAVPAKVIKLKAAGDSALRELINNAMNLPGFSGYIDHGVPAATGEICDPAAVHRNRHALSDATKHVTVPAGDQSFKGGYGHRSLHRRLGLPGDGDYVHYAHHTGKCKMHTTQK